MAFSGTFVIRGSGKGVVVATGERTEFGKIAKIIKETKETETPLQRKLADFAKFLMYAVLVAAGVNFAVSVIFGYTPIYAFLASVALPVAFVPEMLPPLVTVALAMAASEMAKRKALIRRLPAAETLGCCTVICSDKTGTLTKNEMTVLKIYSGLKEYTVTGTGYSPEGAIFMMANKLTLPPRSIGH